MQQHELYSSVASLTTLTHADDTIGTHVLADMQFTGTKHDEQCVGPRFAWHIP